MPTRRADTGPGRRERPSPPQSSPATVLCVVLILALASCRRPAPPLPPAPQLDPTTFSGDRALAEVGAFIALGPHHSGTPGAERAAVHIADRLRTLGLPAIIDEFSDATPVGPVIFRNVLAEVEGTGDAVVILAAHYDTKSGISDAFIGANDSGSGVGLLLELARGLAAGPKLPGTVLLAFLDGEECMDTYGPNDGLHGSRQLARSLVNNQRARHVAAVFVLDMIGDKNLSITVPRNSTPELIALIFDAARNEGARLAFGLYAGNILDDHVPFLEEGLPAIDLIDFEYGSTRGANDYWHTDEDSLDKLSAASLETVGRVVIRAVNQGLAGPGGL